MRLVKFDKALFEHFPNLQAAEVAFIDLSRPDLAPKITIAGIDGALRRSFPIPEGRYAPGWVHWGPGITYDAAQRSIWYLAPLVGLTEFDLDGRVKSEIAFPKASHQIQILPGGSMVLPYSWDAPQDAQLSVIDRSGRVILQWRAKDYVDANTTSRSPAPNQPRSFTATTSAVRTDTGNFFVALAERNMIVKLDSGGQVVWKRDVSIRPHTLVVQGEELLGFSARNPNRLILRNESCRCEKEVLLVEGRSQLDDRTRTLSLQNLGKSMWFTSGVTGLYILNDEGQIFWHLSHDQLTDRPRGFHAAVLIEPH